MCPSPAYIRSSGPGRRRSMSGQSARDTLRELRALFDRLLSSASSGNGDRQSSGVSCLLPLSRSQSLLLADLATTTAQRSTWWSLHADSDTWLMCGVAGEDSGPRVIVSITAISDRDVIPS